ncbi:4-oxalocrotonate tautomerase family protein [bacterium]|nr:4-oxalocrotonate tautomerase family protein [bacterium]
MPMVEVKWYKGRSADQKKQVADAIEKAMQEVGVPRGVTQVVFLDLPKEDWFIPGMES